MGKEEIASCGRSMMVDFDDNILTEILLHLSMKRKIQCKTVCKRWLRLISAPYFAERVLAKQQDRVSMQPWYLLHQSNYTWNCEDDLILCIAYQHNPEFTIETFQLDYENKDIWPRVYATHNGLFLCHYEHSSGRFFVCNPLTRQQVYLPRQPRLLGRYLMGFIVSCENGSSTFKVVRVSSKYQNDSRVYGNVEVFSSQVGHWMDTGIAWPGISGLIDCDSSNCEDVGVAHDGKLHWRAR